MTGIPLPGAPGQSFLNGLGAGSKLYSNIMAPILEREKNAQAKQLAEAQQARQFQQHLDNLAIQKQTQARLNESHPLHMALLNAQRQQAMANAQKAQMAMQNPVDKTQEAVNKAVAINDAKSRQKKIDELEKNAQMLIPYAGHAKTVSDILEKKPDLTGKSTQLANYLGMTKDEDVGKFVSASGELQARLARELSKIGGSRVADIVASRKPDIGQSYAFNKGAVSETSKAIKQSLDQMNDEYKRLTGKDLPYKYKHLFEKVSNKNNQKRLKWNASTGRLE